MKSHPFFRLNESLVLGEFVQPVPLARFSPSFSGSSCVEAGWSQLGGHRRLQWSQTSLIDKQQVGVLYIVIVMILTPE